MAKVRFVYNSAGYQQILKSPEVAAMLQAKAERVRVAVEAQYPNRPPRWQIIANTRVGRTRARAIVSGVPMRDEAAHRIMGSALDAAR